MTPTLFVQRPDGRVAFDLQGRDDGHLVVLVPGMGDLRSTYRFVAPRLAEAGFRVATMDLRGHGDSDAGFPSYGDAETAGDILALVNRLGGPAVVIGNSMAAGAAVYAAAERPDAVAGLILLGPFVRNPPTNPIMRLAFRVLLAPAWAATVWKSYLPSLYAGHQPDDLADHIRQIATALKRPGYAKAFSLTTRVDHGVVAARLGDVAKPTLVLMGEQDPDFTNPRAEAEWIAETLGGTAVLIPDAGHYPQSQQPERVLEETIAFLRAELPDA